MHMSPCLEKNVISFVTYAQVHTWKAERAGLEVSGGLGPCGREAALTSLPQSFGK